MSLRRLGLIVNPVAGLGGRVGLKGSDGAEVQEWARQLGATPQAHLRAEMALKGLLPLKDQLEIYTAPGEMGEHAARACGFEPQVVGSTTPGHTTAEDTQCTAAAMRQLPVDLLLFAGGDGTARDVYHAVGLELAVLGIPAGVKIHSAAFAVTPLLAGELAAGFLQNLKMPLREAEVVDLDEEAYRQGRMVTQLHGYLKIPFRPRLAQNQKVPTPASEAVQAQAIAAAVVEQMQQDWLYILGPGTTLRAVCEALKLPKTLVGVDAVRRGALVAQDASEATLLELVAKYPAKIVITPTGGQGFLLGRGNQQISPAVIRRVGKQNIIVVCLPDKLNALQGSPLLVDTGDRDLDDWLSGYVRVITGYNDRTVYRVGS